MATITIGETGVLTSSDQNANRVSTQRATLAQAATLQSLSVYWVSSGGNTRLAVYDDSGASSGPGQLLAQTAAVAVVGTAAWQLIPVETPVLLQPGNYWLCLWNSTATAVYKRETTGGTSALDSGVTHGPSYLQTFVIEATASNRFSLFATLTTVGIPILINHRKRRS